MSKNASVMKVFLLMKTHFIAYFPYLMVNFLTVSPLFWNAVCKGPFSTQKDEFSHCCIEANENESRESWSIWSLFRKKYGYHNGVQALKSDNFQYNTLGRYFFLNFTQIKTKSFECLKAIRNYERVMLGTSDACWWVVYTIDPATQRIILKIVGFMSKAES